MKIIVFSAPWCGQCNAYHPTVDKFAKKHPELVVETINADEDEQSTSKYNIKSLPTTILINNDKEVNRRSGMMSMSDLENFIV